MANAMFTGSTRWAAPISQSFGDTGELDLNRNP